MEMGIAAGFTGGTADLWVGSSSTVAQTFVWTNGGAAFISDTSLWCPSNLLSCELNYKLRDLILNFNSR
jgi:hypothetical protein